MLEQPKQFDNINERVVDDLKVQLQRGGKISIAAASFSIYAYETLKEQLEGLSELRFIFTSPTFTQESVKKQKREFFIPKLNRERNLYGSDFEIQLRNKLTQKAIAKECADWIRRKVKFKTNTSDRGMNNFLNVDGSNGKQTYMPFNEFTTTELGCEKGNNMFQLIMRMPSPFADAYLNTFNELWNDRDNMADVTDVILNNIETVYRENAPEFIYFVTLYNIFREFLDDISEDVLPNEATGFKNSVVWSKLYNFQKDAALAIINKLEKYNGCILADSVGLGKTFTALSVIKYYENRNKSVLVLCPKKLNDNWITFRSNYKNNPIAADRLRYDILFHTDLSRKSGSSNGLDLTHINLGNYDLVVIDESHNFRNGGKIDVDDGEKGPRINRYTQLMNKVIRAGVKTKVLMLSATPVNNRFNDLKNQIQLAYEGDTSLIDDLLDTTKGIDDIFREAQKAYNKWAKQKPEERTTQALLDTLSFDFFEILDAVTIARSRKHIQRYYDTADIGSFPERLKPISVYSGLTDLEHAINFNEIYKLQGRLNLAIYVPSEFILESRREKYATGASGHSGLTQFGREMGVRRLMGINLLKRLESSVNSFRLTLQRIQDFISTTLNDIDEHMSTINVVAEDIEGFDMDDSESDFFVGNKKVQIALEDMDYVRWRGYLDRDYSTLNELLDAIRPINAEHDEKLNRLFQNIKNKATVPINEGNRKVIVFTAFSDTAQYLYENLADKVKHELGLDSALITGGNDTRSTKKLRTKLDFNAALTLFSPRSKDKASLYPEIEGEIDVLFATDCISEGQNLQDCDYLINYDIHWNPVRLVQRFGRIDRIGSKNSVIQLVNYWPAMDLDKYIDLKRRVEARMKVGVMVSTGDDNILTPEEEDDLKYREEQLKRMQEEVVDLEDITSNISIMDLGLNEFRLDLLSYMKQGHNMEGNPNGTHCILPSSASLPPGVIFIMKNRSGDVNIDKKNRLHPFYLCYITDEGETYVNHLEPKRLLDILRQACVGKAKPDMELCRLFNEETSDGLEMSKYSDLLQSAISSIVDVKGECDIMALFDGLEEDIFSSAPSGLDDFELICFFVIK